jgi:diacylglycerol kinase (ATP)
MLTEPKLIKKPAKALHRLQDAQAASVRMIGDLRRKLEKRNRQLHTREEKMAALKRQAYPLSAPGEQPAAVSAKALRPARLIINPNSGSFARQAESPEKLVALLRTHGIQAEVYLKTSTKAVHAWVREAVKNKEALVIAVGGDGTIDDVAAELVGTHTALGVLPTGTMNNLARELGIPLNIDQACELLGAGITRQVDVGCIWSGDKSKASHFLETAGLGLAIALPAGQNVKKGRWGKLPEDFRKLFELGPTPVEIELDHGMKIETKVQLVTISNAPLYGLNNLIAPDAKMDDGLFDLAVYDGLSDLELAGYFLKTAKGQRISDPNVRFYRARRVQIRSHQELHATSDKDELVDHPVLNFELMPRALTMIVGKGAALVWPVEAVPSVPPLAGAQSQPKIDPGAAPAQPTNGKVHVTPTEPLPHPEPILAGARDERTSK